jgi:hypothetical protein
MKQLQQDPEVNNYTIHRQIRHFKVNDWRNARTERQNKQSWK